MVWILRKDQPDLFQNYFKKWIESSLTNRVEKDQNLMLRFLQTIKARSIDKQSQHFYELQK